MRIKSSDIAKKLGVSERHARRLIEQDDVRVHPFSRAEFLRCSRLRVGGHCHKEADALRAAVLGFRVLLHVEAFNEGPEIDRLGVILRTLNKTAGELAHLGHKICDL